MDNPIELLMVFMGAFIGTFLGSFTVFWIFRAKEYKDGYHRAVQKPNTQPKVKMGIPRVVIRDDKALFEAEQRRKGLA